MRFKKEELHNEALKASIVEFKKEIGPATQNVLLDEMTKAKFWVPTKITPAPIKTASGQYIVTPKHKVNMVSAHQVVNGKELVNYIAFTDADAYKAWAKGKRYDIYTVAFDELAVMLLRPTSVCDGVVVNPATDSIRLTTEAVKQAVIQRDKKQEEESKDSSEE